MLCEKNNYFSFHYDFFNYIHFLSKKYVKTDISNTEVQNTQQEAGQNTESDEKEKDKTPQKQENQFLSNEEKEIVFDLKSEEMNKITDYKTPEYGTNRKIDNLVTIRIPQVNYNTKDVKEFNNQMKKFSKKELERYQISVENQYEWDMNTDYRYFENKDILSIILFNERPDDHLKDSTLSNIFVWSINSFNFNKKTGDIMTDEELLEYFNIDHFEEKSLYAIEEFFKDMKNYIESLSEAEEKKESHNILSLSLGGSKTILWRSLYGLENRAGSFVPQPQEDEKYWLVSEDDLSNKKPQLFYNGESKSLFAYYKLNTPAGPGFYYQAIEIEKLEQKKPKLNPVYDYYAKKLNIDVATEDSAIMLSAYLGYIDDSKCFNRLQSMKDRAKLDLNELIPLKINNYNDRITTFGQELFILIPKYDDTALSFSPIHLNDQSEEEIQSTTTFSGNIFLQANPSDLYSNCEVQINYKDELVKYRPSVDLNNNSNIVIKNILDISPLIEKELSKKSDDAREYLEKFLPKG